MKLIGDFLARFNSLTPPNDAVKGVVADAVSHVLGISVSKKSVKIQNGTAFITGSSVMKNALKVRRGEVLQYIYDQLPKTRESLRDVR